MKKKFICIFLFTIFYFIVAEVLALAILIYKYKEGLINSGYPVSFYLKIRDFKHDDYDRDYRKPLISNSNKKPILIFGCSFAFGDGLNSSNNFSGVLHKLTNRTIINRGDGGIGPQIMLYQFETNHIKEIINDCEYIIYVYIPDHLRRNMMFRCWPFLNKVSVRYMLDRNENLKLQFLRTPLQYSNLYKIYESKIPDIYSMEYSKKLLYKIIEKTYFKSQELYPNSKFIILNYSNEEFPIKEQSEKLGIKVISLPELTDINLIDVEYQISKDDYHPNTKAWQVITPLLIDKLSIK